jgi:UDP-N-acetylmuramoylalanine--D-glutamate ligase
MNYYHGDMQTYFSDKAHIFSHQKEDDVLIVSTQAWGEIQERFEGTIESAITVVEDEDISLRIPGAHNRVNALLAVEVCVSLDVGRKEARELTSSFEGIPYRLEFVREHEGVKYYNDSNATSPDAVIAALNSFPDSRVVLIAGGTDKELEFDELAQVLNEKKPDIIFLPGTATDKLMHRITIPYEEASSMKEAVEKAQMRAQKGGVVLLSPGAASFGLFQNEYDRGDQFRVAVQAL